MKKEYLNSHYAELAKRYGIKRVESFRRSARRYECRLNYLYLLECNNAKLSEWAMNEAEKVSEQARRNLSKYCRYYKLFLNDLYINSDPRGYALKLEINHKKVSKNFLCKVDRDWGQFFVVAPQITK